MLWVLVNRIFFFKDEPSEAQPRECLYQAVRCWAVQRQLVVMVDMRTTVYHGIARIVLGRRIDVDHAFR